MTGSEPNPEEVFDVERIRQLVELMEEHGLSEIDLRREEQRIRLRRGNEADAVVSLPNAQVPEVVRPIEPAVAPVEASAAPVEDDKNVVIIKSPMVGTFYGRPNPDSPSFVQVGDNVSADTTVCIIEAMKVMNQIKAEKSGVIQRILVDDASPVEFGQGLFVIA